MEWEGKEKSCIFCTDKADLDSIPINEHQARFLCTVLNFECSVPSRHSAAKYLNTFPCSSCQEWVFEAERVVEEWELILDKIRSVASHFKRIKRQPTERRIPACPQYQNRKRIETAEKRQILHSREAYDDADYGDLLEPGTFARFESQAACQVPCGDTEIMKCEVLINCENPSEVCNVSDASRSGTEEADPDWIPEDEVPPPPKLKLRNLNASLTKKRSHSGFTSAQRAVLLQEYEEHEELLSRTRYDDPDAPVRKLWESVARAVSAVEENAPKTPFICWTKLQPNILQTKQREAWTYIEETSQGPVKLQYFQIQIARCDTEPSFDTSPLRPSLVSTQGLHHRETMKRLRQKAQRRKDRMQEAKRDGIKRRGRPSKYNLIQGTEESCPNPRCGFKSTDPDHLAGHFRRKHLRDPHPYKCKEPNCAKAFTEFRRLVTHREAHQGRFGFSCEECGKQFERNDGLRYHVLMKHTENPTKFTCEYCGKTFNLERALKAHIQITHGSKTYKCTVVEGCDASFKARGSLVQHQRRVHPEKFPNNPLPEKETWMCAECGATFRHMHLFRRHMLKHEGASIEVLKPHVCRYEGCSFRTATKSGLKNHTQLIHEIVDATIQCSEPSCAARFKTLQRQRNHFRRVHEPKPTDWTCDFCGLILAAKKALEDHVATQHTTGNKQDFPCGQCDRGFPTRKYLLRHQKKHPNCKPREFSPNAAFCEICKKYCSNAAGLKRHNHLVHNSELRPWECDKCGKNFPIKMYLMRHERESKSCGGSNPNKEESPPKVDVVVTTTETSASNSKAAPLAGGSEPVSFSAQPPPPLATAVTVEKMPAPSGAQNGEEPHPPQRSSLQIPFTQTPSQMQQDFYFAFYGIQTSNPQ